MAHAFKRPVFSADLPKVQKKKHFKSLVNYLKKEKEIEGVGRTYNAFGIDQEQMLVVTGLHSRQHVLALRALRLANQEISVL